jgi:predicted metal-dependent phosphoesterase TrpH
MRKVVEIIHNNRGTAVLAHPGVNLHDRKHLLEGVLACGFDGIEAFSSYHTTEQAGYFFREAIRRRLRVTCGSDFHGKTKPSVFLGEHGGIGAV